MKLNFRATQYSGSTRLSSLRIVPKKNGSVASEKINLFVYKENINTIISRRNIFV